MSPRYPASLPIAGRRSRRLLVFLLIGLSVSVAPFARFASSAPAASPAPSLRAEPEPIEASESLAWSFQLIVTNPLEVGLYPDSLRCDVESLDPATMGGGRHETRNLDFMLRGSSRTGSVSGGTAVDLAVSAGESGSIQLTLPASAEHARLGFVLYVHDGAKKTWSLTHEVEALPGPFTRDHPSLFTTANGRKVEYVVVHAAGDSAGPALLYVHGGGSSARQSMAIGQLLAARGYTTMLVSMPGYGQSEGPADLAGPATVAALNAALDVLGRTPGVDSTRIGVWGVARGATAAMNTAVRRASVRAAIGQSGSYDVWAVWRAAKARHDDDLTAEIERVAGSDSAAWRERSPTLAVKGFRRPVLLIHAEDDPRAPIAQARDFADALKANGATVETRFAAKGGHPVPQRDAFSAALPFLQRALAR